jgi:hypothetical protein
MGVGRGKELLGLSLEWWGLKGLWLGWWAMEYLAVGWQAMWQCGLWQSWLSRQCRQWVLGRGGNVAVGSVGTEGSEAMWSWAEMVESARLAMAC